MSQPNADSWDDADHVALVMEFAKPLMSTLPAIGTYLAFKVFNYSFDYTTHFRKTLDDWSRILGRLTEAEKVILERESSGIVERMTKNLDNLERALAFLAVFTKEDSYFGYALPWTGIKEKTIQVKEMFKSAEVDFTRTSKRLWQDDMLRTIISADNAASEGLVEMANLATSESGSGGPEPVTGARFAGGPGEAVGGNVIPPTSSTVRAPLPRVPEEAHLAYRYAAALTTALLPAFLQGRHRAASPYDVHPV